MSRLIWDSLAPEGWNPKEQPSAAEEVDAPCNASLSLCCQRLGSQSQCCSSGHFADRALLAAHQAERIAAPWMEGNFAQSAKDKRERKAEGGKKRDHIGSWERKGRGQRAGGWRKGENMKNTTRESAIVRENLFRCFPGCNQSEQDLVFTFCTLPHTVYQVTMAGLPLRDPWQQLDHFQKETKSVKSPFGP